MLDSIRIYIDNYTSDVFFKGRSSVSQKLFYGYVWIIVSLILLLVTGFDIASSDLSIAVIIILSGALGSLGGIPYYKALEIEDSTNLGIFFQFAPILYLIFGCIFFGETISPLQLVALFIILSAPVIIISTARKKSRKVKLQAVFYAFLYVLIAVISNLIFVKTGSEEFSFIHKIALLFLGSGIASLAIVYSKPAWRRRFKVVLKQNKQKLLLTLTINSVLSFIKSTTYRAALMLAPAVALASAAADSTGPIVIFFMGIVLTLIWPKFGREKLNRKSVLAHLAATIVVVIGIVLLQI